LKQPRSRNTSSLRRLLQLFLTTSSHVLLLSLNKPPLHFMRLHGIRVPSLKARPGNKKLLVPRMHFDKQPYLQRCRFQVSFLDKWDSSLQKSDVSFAYLIAERGVPRMTAMKVS